MKDKLVSRSLLALAAGSLLLGGCVYRERVVYRQPVSGETESEVEVGGPPPAPIVEEVGVAPAPGFIWIGGFSGLEWPMGMAAGPLGEPAVPRCPVGRAALWPSRRQARLDCRPLAVSDISRGRRPKGDRRAACQVLWGGWIMGNSPRLPFILASAAASCSCCAHPAARSPMQAGSEISQVSGEFRSEKPLVKARYHPLSWHDYGYLFSA